MHSMTADSPIHGSAMLMMNSGKLQSGSPALGSWVNYGLGSVNENLPGFVVMLDHYKKLIVRGGQIAGAILLGDVEAAGTLMQMFMAGTTVPARRADSFFGSPTGVALLKTADLPDNAQICNCNGVSKLQILDAIQTRGCRSVSKVGAWTKAGMGCGWCKSLVAQLLESYLGEVGYPLTEHYYVPGVPLESNPSLVAEIRNRGITSGQ